MSARDEELESMREDGLSELRRGDFRASAAASAAWERAHPTNVATLLDWIDQLRQAFGDPPVDRRPSRGDDFRL